MRRVLQEKRKIITKELFFTLLKTGALLCVAFTAPGAIRMLGGLSRKSPWDKYYPSSIERLTRRLYRKGIVKIIEKDGEKIVTISKKGKTELLRFSLDNLTIDRPSHWDKRWRVVLFDIPEKYRRIRDIVRRKLKKLGFYQFQESVFVYPYSCEKEIAYLREILFVPHSIKLILAERVENDDDLKKIFRLH